MMFFNNFNAFANETDNEPDFNMNNELMLPVEEHENSNSNLFRPSYDDSSPAFNNSRLSESKLHLDENDIINVHHQ